MKVLDLFSGIAGMHLGLAPFGFDTVAFCDIDERARRVLRARMADGSLPVIPVHEDVRTLSLRKGEVDMIVGGFPCTDVSRVGPRGGIPTVPTTTTERSSLIHDVVRLTREASPSFVFMENVQHIVNYDNYDRIVDMFRDSGYVVRWTTSRASDFGAPHQRHRWWCLCVRRDLSPSMVLAAPEDRGGVIMYDWDKTKEPNRTGSVDHRDRPFVLGNALVPCVATRMFVNLWTASTDVLIGRRQKAWNLDTTYDGPLVLTKETHPPRNIVLDPGSFVSPAPPGPKLTLPIVRQPRVVTHWSTPRASSYGPSNFITTRSIRDLATQVRFERDTTTDRRGRINPEFVEFLMGFPVGWTAS